MLEQHFSIPEHILEYFFQCIQSHTGLRRNTQCLICPEILQDFLSGDPVTFIKYRKNLLIHDTKILQRHIHDVHL